MLCEIIGGSQNEIIHSNRLGAFNPLAGEINANPPFWLTPGSVPSWLEIGVPPTPPAPGQPSVLFPVNTTLPPQLQGNNISQANINTWRYWQYRQNLKYFRWYTHPNTKGSCLPAETILAGSQDGVILSAAKWGDTTIHLGWYIGVLATEIGLLMNSNYQGYGYASDLRNATRELFCALGTLERLDQYGEDYIWQRIVKDLPTTLFNPKTFFWPNTPGYFLRDDVGVDTMTALGHIEIPTGFSDFTSLLITDPQMSQDQVIHLLMGLALVKQFVPDYFNYQGKELRLWAIRLSEAMLSHIAKDYDPIPGNLDINQTWVIKDPMKPKVRTWHNIPYFDPFHPTEVTEWNRVHRGAEAIAFAYGLNAAGNFITGKYYPVPAISTYLWTVQLPPIAYSYEASMTAINSLQLSNKPPTADNLHMLMSLEATGNAHSTFSPQYLETLAVFEDFYLYPLLNSVLHYGGNLLTYTQIKVPTMLQTAPYGAPSSPPTTNGGWGSRNRFITRLGLQANSGDGTTFPVIYNGLDYMLLNNLYYLAYPGQFKKVAAPNDRPDMIDPMQFNYPPGSQYKMAPIGYAYYAGAPWVANACTYAATTTIPINVEYDDFDSGRANVQIDVTNPAIGYLTRTDAPNHFEFHGAFWDQWVWSDTIHFTLRDPDNQTYGIDLPISYPGAVRQAPEMGHILAAIPEIKVTGVVNVGGVDYPAYGTIEWKFTVYTLDTNCFPPREASWWVVGMNNAVGIKKDQYTLKVITGWTILDLHGTGKITLASISDAGGPVKIYEIPLSW